MELLHKRILIEMEIFLFMTNKKITQLIYTFAITLNVNKVCDEDVSVFHGGDECAANRNDSSDLRYTRLLPFEVSPVGRDSSSQFAPRHRVERCSGGELLVSCAEFD